ncbi:hypothetical protein CEXT_139651 [Caerostris extrusa]|uniref:Uncharacterized protein n=1 Tax=Caerostris extrusa TaxID=172846 RepID=A0AAV4RCB5_CAEEX|nr:hypothetical protein CEXT_139651 [Caerostris extrusa]
MILQIEVATSSRWKGVKLPTESMMRWLNEVRGFVQVEVATGSRWKGVKLPTESMMRWLNEVRGIRSGCAEMCITGILLVF